MDRKIRKIRDRIIMDKKKRERFEINLKTMKTELLTPGILR